VPGASIGYQKHLLLLKVIKSQIEQQQVLGRTGVNGLNKDVMRLKDAVQIKQI